MFFLKRMILHCQKRASRMLCEQYCSYTCSKRTPNVAVTPPILFVEHSKCPFWTMENYTLQTKHLECSTNIGGLILDCTALEAFVLNSVNLHKQITVVRFDSYPYCSSNQKLQIRIMILRNSSSLLVKAK